MMSNARGYVKALLLSDPKLRDDDRALIAEVYRRAALEKYGRPLTFVALTQWLTDFMEGAFPSPESIRRSRALLQENFPNLRGKRYRERQAYIEREVRVEVKQLKADFSKMKFENRGGVSGNRIIRFDPDAGQ